MKYLKMATVTKGWVGGCGALKKLPLAPVLIGKDHCYHYHPKKIISIILSLIIFFLYRFMSLNNEWFIFAVTFSYFLALFMSIVKALH